MTLITESLRYLKNTPNVIYLVALLLLDVVLNIIVSDYMIKITKINKIDGFTHMIALYLAIKYLTDTVLSYITSNLSLTISNNIQIKFYNENTKKYAKLTRESKDKNTHIEFEKKLGYASHAIMFNIQHGIPQICQLASSILTVIYTFYQTGLIIQLVIFTIVYMIFYFRIMEIKQSDALIKNDILSSINIRGSAKLEMASIPFQYGEHNTKFITDLKENVVTSNSEINKIWNHIYMFNNNFLYTISSMMIFICTYTNPKIFLLIINAISQLTHAISRITHFLQQFQRDNNKYNMFERIWDTVEFESDNIIKRNLKDYPEGIIVKDLEILRDKYLIKMDGEIIIKMGHKFLIQGPSGGGKTSFIKGLFGLIKTSKVTWSIGNGIEYFHTVADYFQEIKERMPSSKVSIRDYFKGEKYNSVIERYLKQAWKTSEAGEPGEYDRILDSIKKSNIKITNSDTDDSSNGNTSTADSSSQLIQMDMVSDAYVNVFDMPINDILSGGQKSRLILWTRGHIVDTMQKEIIILDEPCPDVDFTGYIDNIKRFYAQYARCMIIMVGHMCDCKRKALEITFDTELWIADGVISKK
jgi:ABC-type Mn2+/Zn2+ transport system ATPase subunit